MNPIEIHPLVLAGLFALVYMLGWFCGIQWTHIGGRKR